VNSGNRSSSHFATAVLPASIAVFALIALARMSHAQTGGLYVYPSKGQSQTQQDRDKYECHQWAVSQSGFDPAKAQGASPSQQQKPQGHVVRGAARGAALGAVGGAITGSAGTGAAAGAAMGGLAGGFRRRAETRQQEQQQQANTAQMSSGQQAYNRALTACLQGRGYTVN
jgi:Glycine-zipper domain